MGRESYADGLGQAALAGLGPPCSARVDSVVPAMRRRLQQSWGSFPGHGEAGLLQSPSCTVLSPAGGPVRSFPVPPHPAATPVPPCPATAGSSRGAPLPCAPLPRGWIKPSHAMLVLASTPQPPLRDPWLEPDPSLSIRPCSPSSSQKPPRKHNCLWPLWLPLMQAGISRLFW